MTRTGLRAGMALCVVLCLGLGLPPRMAWSAQPVSQALGSDSFASLRSAWRGQPWVVNVWGLSCPACRKDLPQWASLARQHPELRLVMVQVDAAPVGSVDAALRELALRPRLSWTMPDGGDEFLRASIDPQWQGETPFTLLVARDGGITRLLGPVSMPAVWRWWQAQGVTGPGRTGPGDRPGDDHSASETAVRAPRSPGR